MFPLIFLASVAQVAAGLDMTGTSSECVRPSLHRRTNTDMATKLAGAVETCKDFDFTDTRKKKPG